MIKKKVFVSFDYENDKRYKHLLEAWNNNPQFDFVFDDNSSAEINTYNVGRIKAALTTKIQGSTHVLVLVGDEANKLHINRDLIGFRNWINFETHQGVLYGKKIVGVKLNSNNESPEQLLGNVDAWAMSFTQEGIINALNNA